MRKIILGSLCLLVIVFIVISVAVPTSHSMGVLECFGWSSCDDFPEQHCADPGEFVDQILERSYCDYNMCVTDYTILCEDLDSGGDLYPVRVTCYAYDSWNCD
jgi:hypothetical protein